MRLTPLPADPATAVCVSVAAATVAECLALLAGLPLAEVRLDTLPTLTPDDLPLLFGGPGRRVATCRPDGVHSPARRLALLCGAAAAGAAWLDIELDAPPAERRTVRAAARAAGAGLIVSHHDYVRTPPPAELDRLVRRCWRAGADLVKIACRARTPRDAARLLGLLDHPRPLVVAAMGPAGRAARVVAPLLGAPFTFAAPTAGRETAPGQFPADRLTQLLKDLTRE